MLAKLDEHIYGGNLFRPIPSMIPTESTALVLTLWGSESELEGVANLIELSTSEQTDEEINLPSRLHLAHERIRSAYGESLGVEVLALEVKEGLLSWASIGQPSAFIGRQGRSVALTQSLDLGVDVPPTIQAAPLPRNLLGVGEQLPPVSTGHLWLKQDIELILISRSWVPASALAHVSDKERCVQEMAKDHQDVPFWWARFNFK